MNLDSKILNDGVKKPADKGWLMATEETINNFRIDITETWKSKKSDH